VHIAVFHRFVHHSSGDICNCVVLIEPFTLSLYTVWSALRATVTRYIFAVILVSTPRMLEVQVVGHTIGKEIEIISCSLKSMWFGIVN
jgi:hypothetical protein